MTDSRNEWQVAGPSQSGNMNCRNKRWKWRTLLIGLWKQRRVQPEGDSSGWLWLSTATKWPQVFQASQRLVPCGFYCCVKQPYGCTDRGWQGTREGITEDEMVESHHQLNGHEFEQVPGDGEGQGSLACCSPWGCKESYSTEWTVTTLDTHSRCISYFSLCMSFFQWFLGLSNFLRRDFSNYMP